ncbi:MAG: hypothetical protein Q9218_006066 [Villophora microphyllina]
MAARREDRFLMRQRGAGARDIQLSFDLDLPGLPRPSRSPLKPQKSAENRAIPQLNPVAALKPQQTPKSTVPKSAASTKRLPTTATKEKPNVPVAHAHGINGKVPPSTAAIPTAQQSKKASAGRKRKVAPTSTENNEEASHVNPPKRRKKSSTGEQSLRTKSKPSRITGNPTSRDTTSLETNTAEVADLNATEQHLEPSKQSFEITDTDRRIQLGDETPEEPKRRKRKPMVQTQRSSKKPKLREQHPYMEKVSATVDGHEEPHSRVNNASTAIETELHVQDVRVKGLGRGKKLIQSSPASEKTQSENTIEKLLGEPPTTKAQDEKPRKRGRKPKVPLEAEPMKDLSKKPALDPASRDSTSDGKLKKRGRKPKATSDGDVELQDGKPVVEAVKAVEELGQVLLTQEVQPQPSESLRTGKRKLDKKGAASQLQKPREQTITSIPIKQPRIVAPIDARVKSTGKVTKTRATRKPKIQSYAEESSILPVIVSTEPDKPTSDKDPPVQAPRKRGRPAKAQAHISETRTPVGTKQEEPQQEKVPKRRGRQKKVPTSNDGAKPGDQYPTDNERAAPAQPSPPIFSPKETDVVPTVHEATTLPPPPGPKKRGRPKKQPPTAPAAENTINSKPNPRQPRAKSKHSTVASKPRPAIIVKVQEDDGDASDDPISELTPLAPRTSRSSSKGADIRMEHHSNLPRLAPEEADLDATSAQNDIRRLQQPTAPPQKRPTLQAPQRSINDSVAPPLSLVEENANHQKLHVPKEQDREAAEAKEQDLNARLEALSASVKKRRVEAARIRKTSGDRMLNIESKEKKVSRGLENFVFSKVGRKAKAKVTAEGEEIDPELQGLFDQVKGISRGGAGGVGVLKIF